VDGDVVRQAGLLLWIVYWWSRFAHDLVSWRLEDPTLTSLVWDRHWAHWKAVAALVLACYCIARAVWSTILRLWICVRMKETSVWCLLSWDLRQCIKWLVMLARRFKSADGASPLVGQATFHTRSFQLDICYSLLGNRFMLWFSAWLTCLVLEWKLGLMIALLNIDHCAVLLWWWRHRLDWALFKSKSISLSHEEATFLRLARWISSNRELGHHLWFMAVVVRQLRRSESNLPESIRHSLNLYLL